MAAVLGIGLLSNALAARAQADEDSEIIPCAAAAEAKPPVDSKKSALDSCCSDPVWCVRAGAVILKRDRPDSFVILSDDDTGAELLNASDFDFGYQGGVDISIIKHLNSCRSCEFRFFAIDDWSATETTALSTTTVFNIDPPALFVNCTTARSTYDSELVSAELNWRCRICGEDPCAECGSCRETCHVTFLAGFRYLELNEDLEGICGTETPDTRFAFETDNRLYGFQIGLDSTICRRGPWRFEGIAKAGIYHNAAHHRATLENPIGVPAAGVTPIDDQDEELAFVGELGATAVYQFSDNASFRFGYQLLWINGVALASDQVAVSNFADGTGIDTDGDVFYHGALVGLEFYW